MGVDFLITSMVVILLACLAVALLGFLGVWLIDHRGSHLQVDSR